MPIAEFRLSDRKHSTELLLFFALTRTHVHKISIGSVQPTQPTDDPFRVSDWDILESGANQPTKRFAPIDTVEDRDLVFSLPFDDKELPDSLTNIGIQVTYDGEPPQLNDAQGHYWVTSDEETARTHINAVHTSERNQLIQDNGPTFEEVMEWREAVQQELETSGEHPDRAEAMRYFNHLEKHTNEKSSSVSKTTRDAIKLFQSSVLTKRIDDRLRTSHKHGPMHQLPVRTFNGATGKAKEACKDLLESLMGSPNDVESHFPRFLSGELSPIHHSKQPQPFDYRTHTLGMPNTHLFLMFAECAYLFSKDASGKGNWTPMAATLTWCADMYCHMYWGSGERTRLRYSSENLDPWPGTLADCEKRHALILSRRNHFRFKLKRIAAEQRNAAAEAAYNSLLQLYLGDTVLEFQATNHHT